MRIVINNSDLGSVVRNALNSMFSEIYSMFPTPPIILLNQTGTFSQGIAVKTWLEKLVIVPQLGTPSIKIGTTSGGNEIIDTTLVDDFLPVLFQQYFAAGTTLYFTVTGGNVNINFDQKNAFFP